MFTFIYIYKRTLFKEKIGQDNLDQSGKHDPYISTHCMKTGATCFQKGILISEILFLLLCYFFLSIYTIEPKHLYGNRSAVDPYLGITYSHVNAVTSVK